MISEFVEYVKQVWKNKPNVSSPLNADRLNHMESGIENNSKKIKETVTEVNELTEKMKFIGISTVHFQKWNENSYGVVLLDSNKKGIQIIVNRSSESGNLSLSVYPVDYN